MQGRARRRGDDRNAMRKTRERLFSLLCEQPLSLQLRLELLKSNVQITHAVRRHLRTVKLIRAVARKDGNAAKSDDLHAVFRPKAQSKGVAAEHDAAHRAACIF